MKNELRNKIIYAIVALIATIVIINYCFISNDYGSFNSDTIGLKMFYTLNGCGLYLPFYIFLAFLSNNIICDSFYSNKKTGFQNFIISRVGFKERKISEIKYVLLSSFLVRVALHIITVVIINCFFAKIRLIYNGNPSYFPETFFAFSNNSLISFVIFIIYSSIGFSIFSLFLYGLIDFVKNQYVYKSMGIIMSVFLVVIPAVVGNFALVNYDYQSYFEASIIYIGYAAGLLSPGIEVLKVNSLAIANNVYFFVTAISYLIIILLLVIFGSRSERKNGKSI